MQIMQRWRYSVQKSQTKFAAKVVFLPCQHTKKRKICAVTSNGQVNYHERSWLMTNFHDLWWTILVFTTTLTFGLRNSSFCKERRLRGELLEWHGSCSTWMPRGSFVVGHVLFLEAVLWHGIERKSTLVQWTPKLKLKLKVNYLPTCWRMFDNDLNEVSMVVLRTIVEIQ